MHWGCGLGTGYLAQGSSVKETSEGLVGERVSGTLVSFRQGDLACLVGLLGASPCPELLGDDLASVVAVVAAAVAAVVVVADVVVVVVVVAAAVVKEEAELDVVGAAPGVDVVRGGEWLRGGGGGGGG